MTALAGSTGGFHEHAPDAAALSEVYSRIAGDLRDEAGVETVMDISMQDISVNSERIPGADVSITRISRAFPGGGELDRSTSDSRKDLRSHLT